MNAADPNSPGASEIRTEFDAAQELRRTLEAQIPPLATSLDGRSFSFRAPLGLDLQVGGYVHLDADGGAAALGQIIDLRLARRAGPEVSGALSAGPGSEYRARIEISHAEGHGLVLGDCEPFHDAPLSPAAGVQVAAFLEEARPNRAGLPIGEATLARGVKVLLDAGGFNRHTLFCGQSGSGKSFSLGVLIEQILLETDLRVVVLDPNSDLVRFREARPGTAPTDAARWSRVADRILVRSASKAGEERLRLRFFELGIRLQAAVTGLDPLADRDEYGVFLDLLTREASGIPLDELQRQLIATGDDEVRLLASRLRNLGLADWGIWSNDRSDSGLLSDLERDDWRGLVVDLGSVDAPDERALIATAVLEQLWERRADRRPVLIVIDEAHNVCPQRPGQPLLALSTEAAVNIAAEGRKYGLYLLVATQRPQKVHENVLSQCDNLVLMRMSAPGDVAHLTDLFAFVPTGLTARAGSLRQGEALVAGKAISHPMFVTFGMRITEEGGADVPATWAELRRE